MRHYAWLLCFTFAQVALADDGALNPMEMAIIDDVSAKPSLATCVSGYYLVKKGDFGDGYQIHKNCAEAGYTGSMIWLSYMYQNGYMGEENPEMSAYWDLRAAEAGSEVGMFNYGLDLLRGYGVPQSDEEGRAWIDRAAALGHKHARELQAADYDLRVVTPDTDEAKYESLG